jgi:hypothetical protein
MKRKLATATVLLLLLVMAGAPAGANAASKDQAHSDLSSLPKIGAYLDSIGIDLGSMVVQQGQLNYAGPNCPGAGWNCTTAANRVVQFGSATQPSTNVVDCSPTVSVTVLGLDECVIVQSSALNLAETPTTLNSASCDVMSASGDAKQKCKIKQSSKKGNNSAEVRQRSTQRGGSPQSATLEASIDQTSESGNNAAKITQTIQQTLDDRQTAAVTQTQNAREFAKVDQTSTTGDNSSDVQQYQLQDENAESQANIDQAQNTNLTLGRNVQAQVTQNSTTGNITSNLRQALTQHQDADSPAGTVTQTEGNSDGGLEGSVTQTTLSPGVIRSTATQDEGQTQDASTSGTLTQTKIGPEFCCATQNGGTTANLNTVTQSSVQTDNNGSGATQFSQQRGHCSESDPGALCTVNQTYTANGQTFTFSQTFQVVDSDRFCNGGLEGGCIGGE